MRRFVFLLLCIASLTGCEQVLIPTDGDATPVENFEQLWHTVNEKYSFFGFKQVDWDSVYAVYRPQVKNDMNVVELFDVMADMLFTLRDGHVNLRSQFDVSRNFDWYLNAPPNFNYDIVERNYLRDDYRITGPFLNTAIDSVGYVYYGSFSSSVSEFHIDFIVNRFQNAKGLIFDVRNNGGGSLSNVRRIMSRFVKEKTLYAYWIYKSGPGRNEFSEPIPQYIEPEGDYRYEKPVVILTNRQCFSATNDFVLAMSALPNVTIVGDTTGGGGGLPYHGELPNGWTYRFSVTSTLTPEGENVEFGIPPDVRVDIRAADAQRGRDTMLDRAIDLLQ
ncbi:Tricorn protease C1 domain-containing protein [Catalinimonas alkaloidigena]|uniref:Tricorn protease C1 domain-containing protein n=1 Tax=Catalinimonas alkaloidigena TaxID=1075417 RepID=A0A1G9BI39_9BACT|nr:S41 family peptidase [Catalinimonas alkaloidigena]SDK38515.1 Tricorn protease C1 domain-containing protein [Catalinimonas alkaloidigena]